MFKLFFFFSLLYSSSYGAYCFSATTAPVAMLELTTVIAQKQASILGKINSAKTEAEKREEKLKKIKELNEQILAVKKNTVVKLKKIKFELEKNKSLTEINPTSIVRSK